MSPPRGIEYIARITCIKCGSITEVSAFADPSYDRYGFCTPILSHNPPKGWIGDFEEYTCHSCSFPETDNCQLCKEIENILPSTGYKDNKINMHKWCVGRRSK